MSSSLYYIPLQKNVYTIKTIISFSYNSETPNWTFSYLKEDKWFIEVLRSVYIFNEFYTVFSFIRKFIFFENIILNFVIEWSKLWEAHKENLTRDILYKKRIRLNNCVLNFNEDMFRLGLYFINETILTYNRSLAKYIICRNWRQIIIQIT